MQRRLRSALPAPRSGDVTWTVPVRPSAASLRLQTDHEAAVTYPAERVEPVAVGHHHVEQARSGRDDATTRTASAPLAAVTTSNPARRSDPDSSSRIVASSSTTSRRAGAAVGSVAAGYDLELSDCRPRAGGLLQDLFTAQKLEPPRPPSSSRGRLASG